MPETRRRRLIEVAFPLEEVSEHSRREKNVRHGHISTLHIWWARRPLAACRAFIYASLVDDPGEGPEREELLKEVADLASWDAVRKPDQVVRPREKGGSGLNGRQLLERARQRILDCNGGKPPRLLDPFAGGGAIPLEALRLGCEVEASDLNPVAVLILKGTVEYPQKYGQPNSRDVPKYIYLAADSGPQKGFFDGDLVAAYKKNPLATDVRFWGNWVLERAQKELAQFYPPDPDGSVPVAYLWSRTVPCPNCGAEMPLIRQYWLARKDKKKVALRPVLDRAQGRVDFEVVEGPDVTGDPAEATTTRGDSVCLLCRQVLKAEAVRRLGRDGKMGAMLTAVVLEGRNGSGKRYRADAAADLTAFQSAARRLAELERLPADLSLVPDEPIARETLGLRIDEFGFVNWAHLFNARQLVSLVVFTRLVQAAFTTMRESLDQEYAEAVTTYLAMAVDRLADYGSGLARWLATVQAPAGTFGRQALPMVWDYCEVVPTVDSGGGFPGALRWIQQVVEHASEVAVAHARVIQRDATVMTGQADFILTDPPYYDAIDYAGLSDFFYVWLKRSVGNFHRELFVLPLTPKRKQAIMASETASKSEQERYVRLMEKAFFSCARSLHGGRMGVVFAHAQSDAWATLIESLLSAGLIPDSSWPIDTEREARTSSALRANLQTSVWMACRPRQEGAGEAFLADVMAAMRPVIRERLLYFWSKGILGADFFISAIGPALSVFGRYEKVMRPDGSEVTVRDFLDLVRRESTTVALEQVLHGADLGLIDPVTRQYVTWVWSYSRAPLEAGEAIALCLATGADYGQVVRPHAIASESREKSKKLVKLRSIRERGAQDEDLGIGTPARPAPLIDELQRAAWLWGQNKQEELAKYRAQLGETRWQALRTLGQAVAQCLPDGDEDRRLVNGLLSSSVMSAAVPAAAASRPSEGEERRLPGV
jgi:putative DNA methylase